MGKRSLLVAVIGLCACGDMYGNKPAKLYTPPIVKNHPVDVEPIATIQYDDTCRTDFHTDPKLAKVNKPAKEAATRAVAAANTTYQTAIKMPKSDPQKYQLLARNISEWSDALRKNPYDAEATLGLALAYHQLQRKECALRLLTRISALAAHKDYADAALRARDNVNNNNDSFGVYHNEAVGKLP